MKQISFKRMQGFSLIEIMVVIAIIGIMLALVVPNIIGRPDEAKMTKAKQDVLTIEGALDLYRLDNGAYPTQEQGLDALTTAPLTPPLPTKYKQGGYLKRLPMDPWGHPYQYRNPGTQREIDIFSFGTSGREGGDTNNTYIGNWQ